MKLTAPARAFEGIEETVAPAQTEPAVEDTNDEPTAVPSPTLTPIGARPTATPESN